MVKFDIPRGTRDFLPNDTTKRNYVEKLIKQNFENYGYQQIKTPMFEKFEMLAAKSGDEIRESMFTFVSDREEYALRPELTAPTCRLVSSGKLNKLPLPYKLYYIGECFRYCRPQANRYREFMQAGLELIGSKNPLSDAEIIVIAVKTLKRLGISDFNLKVGNIGILKNYLTGLNISDFNTQIRIINNIDHMIYIREKCNELKLKNNLNNEEKNQIRFELEKIYSFQEHYNYSGKYEIMPEQNITEESLRNKLDFLPKAAESTYQSIWESMDISNETINGLIDLSHIQGDIESVFQNAKDILKNTESINKLEELYQVCSWIKKMGITEFDVIINITRGLDFYTGTVFEIDFPSLGSQKQICGGGRYDKLIGEFGGNHIPATGFGFGFDRVVEAFIKSGNVIKSSPIDVFVAVSSSDYISNALEIAEKLRDDGIRTSVDLLELDLREQIGYANNVKADYVVIIGPEELQKESCKLRELATHSEETVSISSIINKIKEKINN